MKRVHVKKAFSILLAIALMAGLWMPVYADAGLSRGDMAVAIVEQLGLGAQAKTAADKASVFADVKDGSAIEGAVNLLCEKGWVNGVGGGKFNPDSQATQLQAATILLKAYGVPAGLMRNWFKDVSELARWSGLTDGMTFEPNAPVSLADIKTMNGNGSAVAAKPVIGISWKSFTQDYSGFKAVLKEAGAIPVEMPQIRSSAATYGKDGMLTADCVTGTGNLIPEIANKIKAKDFASTNAAEAMTYVDGMFFTGGEDISPNLFATPVPEANHGEEINATRDISDYTLLSYCIEKDIPTFCVCRAEQMLSIVSGATFIQDIPDYYASKGATYTDTHRMPPDAPNRTYARHDVEIDKTSKWLYDIIGSTELKNVSSWHHQAVGDVSGTPLTVVARTVADGVEIIEGLERQDKTFILGVQFHPENDCKLVYYDKTPEKALCDVDSCMNFFRTLVAYAADRPVIGISWKSHTQNYEAFKCVIRTAGGIPVEMPQVRSTVTTYGEDGMLTADCVTETGNLKTEYADVIKSKDFSKSNVEEVVAFKGIDGMFFTGGEDISPNLFAKPVPEANHGEEINATRDISDYTLLSYCIEKDIPTFCVCRAEQMLSIVSGATFIQDIPDYYASKGATYADTHRMPPNAPNRTYARHDVEILDGSKWMENIVGGKELKNVSSWHHQAVGDVSGTPLTVVARTVADGVEIIEGIERQDKTFILGVQFHPENDCKLVYYDKTPEKALCNVDTCMGFFRTLISYAQAGK